MEITTTFEPDSRAAWRAWLEQHHKQASEIWLLIRKTTNGQPNLSYLDAVEEALCFGWIDGIAKRYDQTRSAQRFTPRRPKSNWTELNKERARRLIERGLMTDAGRAVLPNLDVSAFRIPEDILAALQADPVIWHNFQQFSPLYQRVRIGFIDEVRKQPAVFQQRLANFLHKTRQNKQFGGLE